MEIRAVQLPGLDMLHQRHGQGYRPRHRDVARGAVPRSTSTGEDGVRAYEIRVGDPGGRVWIEVAEEDVDEERAAEGVLGYSDIGNVLAVGFGIGVVVEDIECLLVKHRYGSIATEACLDQRTQSCGTLLLLRHTPFFFPSDAATS